MSGPDEPMTLPPAREEPPAPPRPPEKRGRGAFWIAIFLLFLLAGSVLLNLVLFAVVAGSQAGATTGKAKLQQVTLEGEGKDKILVLPIQGEISGEQSIGLLGRVEDMPVMVDDFLDRAAKDESVKAVLLEVDSPGGGVTASDKIWQRIEAFKKERPQVKIVAYFDGLAASGGYYVSAGAHEIVAHQTNLCGSIGVIMSSYDISELLKKVGVKAEALRSSKAEYKDILSPYRPMRPEEKKLLQGIIDEMHERFVEVVSRGRTKLSRAQVTALADGRIYTARQALAQGLVDRIGGFEDAVARAKKLAGLSAAQLVTYRRQPSLLELLQQPGLRGAEPGLQLKLDVAGLAAAERPHFLYLWTGRLR